MTVKKGISPETIDIVKSTAPVIKQHGKKNYYSDVRDYV